MANSVSIPGLLNQILRRLDPARRRQFWVYLVSMIFAAGLETLTLGAIAFFATAVSSPDKVIHSPYLARVQEALPFLPLQQTESMITTASILVFLLVGLKNAFLMVIRYWITRYSGIIQGYFGEALLARFLNARYEWYLGENPSDLINMVQWRHYFGEYVHAIMQLLSDTLIVFVMILSLMLINPLVTVSVLAVLGGTSFFILSRIKRALTHETLQLREHTRICFRHASMAINGFKDVKIYRKEGFFTGAFRDRVYTMARLAGRQRLYSNAPLLILETAGFFMLFVTVVAMLYLMKASTTSVFATLALLAVTAWRILPALNRIMGGVTHSRTTIPFILKVLEYLENTPQEARRIRAEPLETAVFQGSFSLVGVDFLYGGQLKALDDCTCAFLKGKSIGIIGHSGAGKSTLADIIIGLLKPQAGSILLDGREMTDEDWRRWRSIIGYVPQTPYIYDGTIAENVAFGVPPAEADRDLLRDVCRMASMDFIDEMPGGMDTVIGERGIRLSGGQRQRLSIARSLYYKPQVLIFDEATSSLDHKSEKIIQNTIYSLKGKQTLIIIAHRLSTVEDCDYLIWLEKGRLVEIGPPEAIIEKYDDKRLILKR